MFSNKKLTPYIIGFLAFCVVSSKHIIIYNEEILVALSFLLFVIFVSYYFGNTIKESLDERSTAIQSELQNFLSLKKDSLNTLYKEHKKTSLSKQILQNITNFTSLQLKNKTAGSEKALKTLFSQTINTKLKNLSNSNLNVKSQLHKIIADQLLPAVLVKTSLLKNTNKGGLRKTQLNFHSVHQVMKKLGK